MYANINFKTKKAFREAVESGKQITLFAPGYGVPKYDGEECVEGPWYPESHRWYATVTMKNNIVIKVR